ncbi:MAG: 50S ribosomal protein L24 [Patescibacteria group bacterium]|nr:50S ribosomal protein L24 [Patescibacteria group bacterium]MDE2015565.1 50S ribosomal protein L24 [Patescibacteria group bacterium]MDE2227239.1 50S ribosomal protein L24 [Patescibacteria group bacterium]
MYIKKGDKVRILSGKDRGKDGNVLSVFPVEGKITVEGLNLYKKRVRPKQQGQKGETVLVPRPLVASKAKLICPGCKNAVRVGYRFEGQTKVRYCKKCKANV